MAKIEFRPLILHFAMYLVKFDVTGGATDFRQTLIMTEHEFMTVQKYGNRSIDIECGGCGTNRCMICVLSSVGVSYVDHMRVDSVDPTQQFLETVVICAATIVREMHQVLKHELQPPPGFTPAEQHRDRCDHMRRQPYNTIGDSKCKSCKYRFCAECCQPKCDMCKRAGHRQIRCPRCTTTYTYGDTTVCKWCAKTCGAADKVFCETCCETIDVRDATIDFGYFYDIDPDWCSDDMLFNDQDDPLVPIAPPKHYRHDWIQFRTY